MNYLVSSFNWSCFTTTVLNCLVLGAASVLLYALTKKRSSGLKTPWPEVAGRRPFLGNDIGGIENLVDTVEKWADIYGKGGIFKLNLFGTSIYAICNEKTATLLESKRPYSITRRKNLVRAMDSLGVKGLFSAEGDAWQKDRRIVGPALNRKNVREYTEMVKLVTNRLIKKWTTIMKVNVNPNTETEEGAVVSINSDIIATTMDIISLVAFAKDLDSVSKENSYMVDVLNTLFQKTMMRVVTPFPYWKIPIIGQYLDGAGFAADKAKQYCINCIEDFEDLSETNNGKIGKIDHDKISNTFLGKVIALNKKSEASLSTERMVGNLLTMFAAGSETTAGTMTVALYEIANDKTGLQDELAREVEAMENYDSASLEDFTKCLPRLRSLMYEVLRLKGPAPLMGVENEDLITIDGVELPPHTPFFLMMKYISTREDSDSAKCCTPRGPRDANLKDLCPRRWLVEDQANKTISVINPSYRTGFRAFGTGMRVCPGRDLAEIEILITISSVLRNFKISLEPGHPPMRLVTRLTQTPHCDIRLMLRPR
jgi:cytochrome P450